MRYDWIRLVATAALFTTACSSSSPGEGAGEAPTPTGVVPAVGYPTAATAIEIDGAGFLVKATRSSDGGTPTIDTRHRAWLGDAELSDVTWVGPTELRPTHLTATVPVGLPVGPQTLTVENAIGGRGSLDAAFTVLEAPSFSATLSASKASVNVGQQFTVTLTVSNARRADVVEFALGTPTLAGAGAATLVSGPTPGAPATLAAGDSQGFTWTYSAATAGALTVSVSATGKDGVSGDALTATPPAPAQVTVQTPAALTATLDVPGSVALGRDITVSMTVSNGGGATARGVAPAAPAATLTGTNGATATLTSAPTPDSAPDIAGGASQVFTWTYRAGNTRGTLTITGSASGSDGNDGSPASATAPNRTVTLAEAAIDASVTTPPPATINPNQSFTVTIRFANSGTAAVTNFAAPTPTVTNVAVGDRSPAPLPTSLAAGATLDVTWTLTPTTTGNFTVTFTATGTDSSNNQALPTTAQPVSFTVAPAAPTGLTATAVAGLTINLSWTASTGAASYTILRGTTSGGPYSTTVGTTSSTSFSNNTGLTAGTTYYYVVTASNAGVTSGNSSQASATALPAVPSAPTNLAVSGTPLGPAINLTWTASTGATSYTVLRGTASGGPYSTTVGTTSSTSISNTPDVTPGTTYYYVVTASNAGGTSGNSTQASATALAAPTGLVATPGAGGSATITLTWTGSAGVTGYTIYRSTTSGGPYSTTVGTTSSTTFPSSGLQTGTTYYYVVQATSTGVASANSTQASAAAP